MALTAGGTVGRYELIRCLGEGGMGSVWLARSVSLNKPVAVKTILSQAASDPLHREAFFLEASTMAKLSHPNIIKVEDFGQDDDGGLWLSMEYASGSDLAKIQQQIAPSRLPVPVALAFVRDTARALEHIHASHVIHRDIKPSNLMIDKNGHLLLVDFGVTKDFSSGKFSTQHIKGTPAFMAPELVTRKPLPASDIFALGVLLYEICTGGHPFVADTIYSQVMKAEMGEYRRVREFDPYIPPHVEQLIDWMIIGDPTRRPSATDVVQTIRRMPEGQATPEDIRDWLNSVGVRPPDAPIPSPSANRVASVKSMPQAVPTGQITGSGPAATVPDKGQGTATPSLVGEVGAVGSSTAPRSSRRTLILAIAGSAVVAIGGVVVAISATSSHKGVSPEAGATSSVATAAVSSAPGKPVAARPPDAGVAVASTSSIAPITALASSAPVSSASTSAAPTTTIHHPKPPVPPPPIPTASSAKSTRPPGSDDFMPPPGVH